MVTIIIIIIVLMIIIMRATIISYVNIIIVIIGASLSEPHIDDTSMSVCLSVCTRTSPLFMRNTVDAMH